MKATILIDGVEYTGELVEKKKGKFRAKKHEKYWFMSRNGMIDWGYEVNLATDNLLHLIGNYFATKEKAEEYKAYLEALGRVTHAVYEMNDGWEPDWSDIVKRKWYIYFDNSKNTWGTDYNITYQYPLVIPYIKSVDLAKKLIKDHLTDLEVIRKYKV